MNIKTTITTALLLIAATVSYSQVVASVSGLSNLSSFNTMMISQLSYDVLESEDNLEFEQINYSASSQNLSIDTAEEVSSISLYKDGEVYLKHMPVFSDNITLSMKNYEEGDYELHLTSGTKIATTVIEIEKR